MSMGPYRFNKWMFTDWSLPTTQIAEYMGCQPREASAARKKYAPETMRTIRRKPGRRETVSWSLVDWSKKDSEIALQTGKSKTTVWRERKRHLLEYPAQSKS